MSDWEGKERHSGNVTLYDVLLEVREVKNNVGHLIEKVNGHIDDDNTRFEGITKKVEKHQIYVVGGTAIILFIQFLVASGAIDIHGMFTPDNDRGGASSPSYHSVGSELRVAGKGVQP